MRAPPPPLLLLVVATAAAAAAVNDSTEPTSLHNLTVPIIEDDAISEADNGTVVRKKRTFGDIVFRGLADVLGYNVARKPTVFPPPLALVPGIDIPLQAAPAPPPPPPPPPPCPTPAPRAAPPCAKPKPRPPPPPPPPPPCAKPRAAPKPKPTPKPPPPPPPPCAKPRANPKATPKPNPCAPPPPPPPQPKPKADAGETVSSNFRLSFNFNRSPSAPAAEEPIEAEQEQEEVIAEPIEFQPRAAALPPAQEQVPRVYVDAFVVRDGVAQRAHTLDAAAAGLGADDRSDDYVTDDDDSPRNNDDDEDDYEDAQESRGAALKHVDNAVGRFWNGHREKQRQKRPLQEQRAPQQQRPPQQQPEHYSNVHFGDRQLVRDIQNRASAEEEENEPLTTTQDPRRTLRPRVLPPTEHHPNQIDTVTIRVPPIYREKRPRKLHRDHTTPPYEDHTYGNEEYAPHNTDEEQSASISSEPEPSPRPPRRRRKKIRRERSVTDEYAAGNYDYYNRKIPVSKEEEMFQRLTVAPPTRDADLARIEEEPAGYFLDDHERLTDDPERSDDDERDEHDPQESESEDDSERSTEDKERVEDDDERAGEDGRADERERTDELSPAARVQESGYQKKYLRESNLQVDDDRPRPPPRNKKTKPTTQPA